MEFLTTTASFVVANICHYFVFQIWIVKSWSLTQGHNGLLKSFFLYPILGYVHTITWDLKSEYCLKSYL